MKIEIKSGFRSGGSVVAVTGAFPEFKVVTLDRAGPCTWQGDPDTSFEIEVDEEDARAIFETWFHEADFGQCDHAKPLNAAARKLCAQPLPEGWGISVPGVDLVIQVGTFCYPLVPGEDIPVGGMVTYSGYDQRVTIGSYVEAVACDRRPTAWGAPAQK